MPRKNKFIPERNVITRTSAVKPCGECNQNLAYKEYKEKSVDTPMATMPRTAAARSGTMEKAKMPSEASFSNFRGLYLVRPA
jgi:hypothetical protein